VPLRGLKFRKKAFHAKAAWPGGKRREESDGKRIAPSRSPKYQPGAVTYLKQNLELKITNSQMPFRSIPDAAADIREGRMIIIVDDEDRENEGDLVLRGRESHSEIINFMARHARVA